MLESENDNITRILVIRAGQLGDTVFAASVINPLIAHFGEDTIIDWVAKEGIGKVFEADPRINKLFFLKSRRSPLILNFAKMRIVFSTLFNPYDYIINLELGSIFNSVVRLARAKNKIGMPYKFFAEPPGIHAVEGLHIIYRSFLTQDELELAQPSLVGTDFNELKEKFSLPDEYVVFVPSNSHHDKRSSINLRAWPVTHWKELLELCEKNNIPVVVVGSESERLYFNKFDPLPINTISLVGKTSFPELVSVIEGAKSVVVTDTGPAHIAAAVDTPVFALIGPTNFKRTGPYQTKTNEITIINSNLHCSPCYHTEKMHTCIDNKCMSEISAKEVMDNILSKQ